jgi:hypothetical protein
MSSMTSHKYEIGRIVRTGGRRNAVIPPGAYEIVRQLPSGDAECDLQYRVKAVHDGHERIVKESEVVS